MKHSSFVRRQLPAFLSGLGWDGMADLQVSGLPRQLFFTIHYDS